MFAMRRYQDPVLTDFVFAFLDGATSLYFVTPLELCRVEKDPSLHFGHRHSAVATHVCVKSVTVVLASKTVKALVGVV